MLLDNKKIQIHNKTDSDRPLNGSQCWMNVRRLEREKYIYRERIKLMPFKKR